MDRLFDLGYLIPTANVSSSLVPSEGWACFGVVSKTVPNVPSSICRSLTGGNGMVRSCDDLVVSYGRNTIQYASYISVVRFCNGEASCTSIRQIFVRNVVFYCLVGVLTPYDFGKVIDDSTDFRQCKLTGRFSQLTFVYPSDTGGLFGAKIRYWDAKT